MGLVCRLVSWPLGSLTEEGIDALNTEFKFVFTDAKTNGEGKAVTPVKFFLCLNKVLKSFDDDLANCVCDNEVVEKGAKDELGRAEYVKDAIAEARKFLFLDSPKEKISEILKKGGAMQRRW